MNCPHCGAPMNSSVCDYCGCRVETNTTPGGVTVNISFGGGQPRNASASGPAGGWNPSQQVPGNAWNIPGANNGYGNSYGYGGYPAAGARPGYTYVPISTRSRLVALLLCLFLGYFGAHYFYVGRPGMGLLYLFTGGLMGIGWMVDIIRIVIGSFRDVNGLPLNHDGAIG